MKDLFVPLAGPRDDGRMLETVSRLGHAYRCHVELYLAAPGIASVPVAWGSAPPSVMAGLMERHALESEARASALRVQLQTAGVSGKVTVEDHYLVEATRAMASRARLADLAMLAGARDRDDFMAVHAAFCALLLESGRPVLMLPAEKPLPAHRPRKLLLAWKPTREAARACHDALTLLQPDVVEVLVVGAEAGADELGAEIATHLARHRLQVDVVTMPDEGPVADAILQRAAETGADAIVAGGYGHARLREWVLGGTTRRLFSKLDRPVLFSH